MSDNLSAFLNPAFSEGIFFYLPYAGGDMVQDHHLAEHLPFCSRDGL